eukprot:Em0007g1325a
MDMRVKVDSLVMGAVVVTMTSKVMGTFKGVNTVRVVAQLKKHEVNNHNQDTARKPYIGVTGQAYAEAEDGCSASSCHDNSSCFVDIGHQRQRACHDMLNGLPALGTRLFHGRARYKTYM